MKVEALKKRGTPENNNTNYDATITLFDIDYNEPRNSKVNSKTL